MNGYILRNDRAAKHHFTIYSKDVLRRVSDISDIPDLEKKILIVDDFLKKTIQEFEEVLDEEGLFYCEEDVQRFLKQMEQMKGGK